MATITEPGKRKSARRARARSHCLGSGRIVAGVGVPLKFVPCPKCYRDVRVTADGRAYKHFAKAPADRTDPVHSKRILEVYGITGQQYEQIFDAQGRVCFICEKPPRQKRLAVDHDHDTGEVRGLLCRRCNHRLLGSAHDATRILGRAIEYLNNPPARVVLSADTSIGKSSA